MDGWPALDDFLRTDPHDVGCARAMEMLHTYAELTAAGAPAEQRYPGIAAGSPSKSSRHGLQGAQA